jgi:hypothetical protein
MKIPAIPPFSENESAVTGGGTVRTKNVIRTAAINERNRYMRSVCV